MPASSDLPKVCVVLLARACAGSGRRCGLLASVPCHKGTRLPKGYESNVLASLFGPTHPPGGDPNRAVDGVPSLDVGVPQVAQVFKPVQLDVVLTDLRPVSRELHRQVSPRVPFRLLVESLEQPELVAGEVTGAADVDAPGEETEGQHEDRHRHGYLTPRRIPEHAHGSE